MKDRIDNLNHEYISPIEVEDRQDAIMNREDFRTGLGQTTHTEEDQYNMRGNQRYGRQNNNNRRGNFRNQNYDRNRSRSYERQNRDRGTIEALVTVDQDQVQEQL